MTRQRTWAVPEELQQVAFDLRPIGVVRSPLRVHHDAPRQARPHADPAASPCAEIHLAQGLQNGLDDLAGFSHVWVLFWCHHTRGWNSKVAPPRDTRKRGVFATRAPARPNPIGLSCLRLLGIDGRVLRVGDHDLLDGTPVLDLKPYLPYSDCVPDARLGYASTLPADAADHRAWWEGKDAPLPRVYRERDRDRDPDAAP
ncbi:MAG: tRNA (N6-threonylcarbamoyladenosine(37)-N6)-methyltransferase TrmO [Planctomycetota bacterium]